MSDKPHGGDGGHDAHGHHGSVYIQHHYDDAQHQFDSGKLGIWLFLAQEVLFFSALFVAYVLYRHHHPEIYSYAHKYLDVKYGAINTAVLIFSSLTAAWAVRAAQLQQKKLLIACISLTIACACGFLVIKYIEYTHKVHEHILFGRYFDPCVSSGERPLLTKNNHCAGHESTVVWNSGTGRADSGCFPDYAIDQDTAKEGVQANCDVGEYKIHYEFTWTEPDAEKTEGPFFPIAKCQAAQKSRTSELAKKKTPLEKQIQALEKQIGELQKQKQPVDTQKAQLKELQDKVGKYKANPCVEKETPTGKTIPEQCPEWRPHGEKHEKAKYPCWRPAYQPAVCKVGYSFTWRDDAEMEYAGPFFTEDDCKKPWKKQNEELAKASQPEANKCARTSTVGIIVEYGEHSHHTLANDLRIKASCKGPAPPPPSDPDPLADKETKLEVGKKSATGVHHLSTHEQHELEAAGPPPEHTNMFFTIYFAMTGLHGIHVLVGVFVFIWLLIRAVKGHFTPDYFGPIDFAALYWHIVDLIWIFLFPLLYLIH